MVLPCSARCVQSCGCSVLVGCLVPTCPLQVFPRGAWRIGPFCLSELRSFWDLNQFPECVLIKADSRVEARGTARYAVVVTCYSFSGCWGIGVTLSRRQSSSQTSVFMGANTEKCCPCREQGEVPRRACVGVLCWTTPGSRISFPLWLRTIPVHVVSQNPRGLKQTAGLSQRAGALGKSCVRACLAEEGSWAVRVCSCPCLPFSGTGGHVV